MHFSRVIAFFVLAGGVLSVAVELRAEVVVFVDQDSPAPAPDGSSWGQAYTSLQQALANAVAGTEIRVAAGTYKPTTGTARNATFALESGVAIRGGFAGCGEADPDKRDIAAYETILSGDLSGDDDPLPASACCTPHTGAGCDVAACEAAVCAERASCCDVEWTRSCAALAAMHCCSTCGNKCDNSFHVVTGSGADATAVLDGFTITAGYADDSSSARDRGAGIFMYFIPSSPTIANCIIRNNISTGKGAGVYANKTTAKFANCALSGNVSLTGAGMDIFSQASPTLINCTLNGNVAVTNFGGIRNTLGEGDYPTLFNCILWGNIDSGYADESAQMNRDNGNVAVNYSCIQGWTGLFGGAGNMGSDPRLADAFGPDGVAGTGDEDLRLTSGSPAIDAGDPAFVPGVAETDLAGQPRVQDCRVDMGAYEAEGILSREDCASLIPTVSEWGLIILTLLLLTAGKLCFGFRPSVDENR